MLIQLQIICSQQKLKEKVEKKFSFLISFIIFSYIFKVVMENTQVLTLFHFNDVYDIQPEKTEPKAGVACFKSLLERYRNTYQNTLTLFSGDAFSPSLLSTQFQGENMIKPLNSFGIDLACFGNHDFDYSLERVKQLVAMTNFPWMLSNVFDNRTERRLAEALEYKIIEKNGIKIGFFSLAEKEWIDTLYPFYKQFCHYVDFLQFADYMVRELKETHKCDMIIALTHMMKYNDVKLAQNVKGIDLILGGHDHLIVQQKVCESVIIKSGTNFRNFSIIEIKKNLNSQDIHDTQHPTHVILSNNKWVFDVKLKEVNHQLEKIIPDPELNDYVNQIYAKFSQKQEKIALYTKKPIDLRFKTIRKEQTPFLEFLVSFYRHFTSADCAFMNSGNFRMDCEILQGPITFGVIDKVIEDQVVVKQVTGAHILKGLENCVSMYPNLAGRYSALSGLAFEWDSSKQPFERVSKESVRINGEHIVLDRVYKVAMHSFMGMGGDGFECFKQCPASETCIGILNKHIIHELITLNKDLINTYTPKYPNRFQIIEIQGHRYLELNLPEPKNVRMIHSVNHA